MNCASSAGSGLCTLTCATDSDCGPNQTCFLGNASGGFTQQSIPKTTTGIGDQAYALDYNHDGLTDFLVLNGQVPSSGPIQLLTPSRS